MAYVPILKGKEGEYGALGELTDDAKAHLTPLIEIPPIPWDFEAEAEMKTLEQHIAPVGKKLEDNWGTAHPVLVDFGWIEDDRLLADGMHHVTSIMADTRARGVRAIPVTGLGKAGIFQDAVRASAEADGRGACIRLEGTDFQNLPLMGETLVAVIGGLGLTPAQVDVLVDLDEIKPAQVGAMTLAARSILAALPNLALWRTVALAGCGFPQNLADFAPNSISVVPRTEYLIWQAIAADLQGLPRVPTFSDYAVNNPLLSEVDPRQMRMSASLRYTITDAWLVFKGRDARRFGFPQFNAICGQLVARPEYSGPNFSWGDRYVRRCADGLDGPGNATTWRKVGTSHHLALVLSQLAN